MLAFTSGGALAADTQAFWAGLAIVTGSTGCTGVGGTGAGDVHVSVYRPKIKSTDTSSFLSLMGTVSAITFKNSSESTAHQMNGSGSYSATAINKRAKSFTYTGSFSLTINPAPVTAATSVVTVEGTINDYFDVVGCNITFQGAYSPGE